MGRLILNHSTLVTTIIKPQVKFNISTLANLRTTPTISLTHFIPEDQMFRHTTVRAVVKNGMEMRQPMAMAMMRTRTRIQLRQAHAISNPTLVDIEKRWEKLPPQEQADLWMSLRDRMKVDWAEMTIQEKKAAYYLAFGPHGPRAQAPPGEGRKVAGYTALCVGISFVLFCIIRSFARPPPSTMTKEYQEATNEYLRANNSEPLTGISSEGYQGKGYVQSGPAKKE